MISLNLPSPVLSDVILKIIVDLHIEREGLNCLYQYATWVLF